MTDKINGRTPEEIKKGLECCKPVWVDNHWKTCDTKCPYIEDVGGFCREQLMVEALALIQQLERERDEARNDLDTLNYANTELHSAYEAMKRERDAAIDRCVTADDVSAGYYQEIEQLEAAQSKWISVEERLPGDPLDCIGDVVELLIHKGVAEEVLPGYYDHEEKDWVIFFGDISGAYLRKYFNWWRVIKWREMPKPPKEET
jgi:hypothetical protein